MSTSVHEQSSIIRTSASIQSTHFSSGSLNGDTHVIRDGKLTMHNLNDRLALYLEKVHSLEAKNKELKLKIKEFCVKKTADPKNFAGYFATIIDLRAEIARRYSKNEDVILQIDNNKKAAEDIKMRYEMELSMRNTVEADLFCLRKVRDQLTITISDLEMNIENLKEESVSMKKKHEEDIHQLQIQDTGIVKVEVDAGDSAGLTKVLEDVRQKYETVVENNKLEQEKWCQSKMATLQAQIMSSTTNMLHVPELSELKRTYQSLQIKRQHICAEIKCLQQNVAEVSEEYSCQLTQLQVIITKLEKELHKLKSSRKQLQVEYSLLLQLKPRLEKELVEYKRLLEGEQDEQKRAVIFIKVTEEVEVQRPRNEKQVKTVVERLVDGQLVSSPGDTHMHTIQ